MRLPKKKRHIYQSSLATRISRMKRAFHDFLTICSSDLSNRQKEEEEGIDPRYPGIRWKTILLPGCALPSLPLLCPPPPLYPCDPSRERFEWIELRIYEKEKKNAYRKSVTTCACNYIVSGKNQQNDFWALFSSRLMGSRVLHVLYIYCARTCTRIFARRAPVLGPRDLSRSLLFLHLWKIPHGATRWGPGPFGTLPQGAFCYLTRGQDVSFFSSRFFFS